MKGQAIPQGHDSHYGLTAFEERTMEVFMGLLAVVVALSCLIILGYSEFKDYRKRLAEIRQERDESGRAESGR